MLDIAALVDARNGLVRKAAYMDEEVYQRELDLIFGRCWLYLAHESQLPNPGDFVSAYMGEDPVIVIRDTAGRIGAFLNVCRHRGPQLCRADAGNAASFTCPYHGWTYGNDGTLISVPGFEEYYHKELDRTRWGLAPVAQVATHRGFVFGTFDPSAPPLRDYLGAMAWWIEEMTDRRNGGIEIVPGTVKWTMKTNWKFAAEQFGGDSYHTFPSHLSAITSGFAGQQIPQDVSLRPVEDPIYTANLGNGHTALVGQMATESQEGLGGMPGWGTNRWPGLGTCFPNLSKISAPFRTLRVWHPRGPHETEVWAWTFVDKNDPPEVKDASRLFSVRTFGAAGGFEQDDGENWNLATEANMGPAARELPLHFGMGIGRVTKVEDPRGWHAPGTSESNARAFFERWQDLLAGKSWEELAATDQTPQELARSDRVPGDR